MEHGVDMTVSNKHYNRLVKEGKTAEASALMSIQTGALWSPQRLQEALIPTEDGAHKCPLCGKVDTDEGHLFWECTKVCQNPDARIQKTNRYCDEYRRSGLNKKCYWWRGLQPLEETTPIHAPRASYKMLGAAANTYLGTKITVYTDGPGGKFSPDPRLRRCGWAWVCPQDGSNKIARHGAFGSLDGKQTVPRAELRAILECLNDLKQCPNLEEIILYSDCKLAVDSFAKGKAYSQLTKCGAIWADIWSIIEELRAKGVSVSMLKVKAHTDDEQVAALPQRLGNQCADHHAGNGVEELPTSEIVMIRWKDRKQRAIQERMILALQMLPWRGRHPQEGGSLTEGDKPAPKKPRIGPAEAQKHVVKRRGPMLECERCGLFWLAANTDTIVSRGICLGHNTYGETPQDRPWVIPSNGVPVIWGSRELHRSHRAKWMRGILYCGQCGCHSIHGQSLRGLAQQCRMNPKGKYAVDTRRMIATGKVRQGVKEWPQTNNYPNKELLGRYDLYPDPKGKENSWNQGEGVQAPPGTPNIYPQEGAACPRLVCKTSPSGLNPLGDRHPNKTNKKSETFDCGGSRLVV